MNHLPLADYLNAFLGTGLQISRFLEPGDTGVPHSLAVRAVKPTSN
jgi:hypothetical protein